MIGIPQPGMGGSQVLVTTDANGTVQYVGVSNRSVSTASSGWTVYFITASGNEAYIVRQAYGIYDDKGTMTYE